MCLGGFVNSTSSRPAIVKGSTAPCMMFDPRLLRSPSMISKQAPSAVVFAQQAHTHTHTHTHTHD